MPQLTIQFFDVGQGDGTFIVFPPDKSGYNATMLIDLGSTKNKPTTGPNIRTYFKKHTKFEDENQTLDYLVITHGDRDHYNMIIQTLAELKIIVKNYTYGGKRDDYGSNGRNFISQLKSINEAQLEPSDGDQLGTKKRKVSNEPLFRKPPVFLKPPAKMPALFGCTSDFGGAEVMWLAVNTPVPLNRAPAWRKNTASVVLQIVYGGTAVMLTGDATTGTENTVIADMRARYPKRWQKRLESTVLKVGHHGSHRTSNSVKWIKAVNPEYVFISSDRMGSLDEDEKSGHRLPQYLTLDLLENYALRLAKNCEPHYWVSAYDPADYEEYNEQPDIPNKTIKDPISGKQCWLQDCGPLGIFTTLTKMDSSQPDGSKADQGAQYALVVKDDGALEILTTLDDKEKPTSLAKEESNVIDIDNGGLPVEGQNS